MPERLLTPEITTDVTLIPKCSVASRQSSDSC